LFFYLGLPQPEKMKTTMPPDFDPINNNIRSLYLTGIAPKMTEPVLFEIFSAFGKNKHKHTQTHTHKHTHTHTHTQTQTHKYNTIHA